MGKANQWQFEKAKLVNFTDAIKQRKRFVPGAGHYKFDEAKATQKLSKPPLYSKFSR